MLLSIPFFCASGVSHPKRESDELPVKQGRKDRKCNLSANGKR